MNIKSEKNLLGLIDLAYEAVESPQVWSDVTAELCKVIGANSGFIMVEDYESGQIQDYVECGIPDGSMARYAEYYIEKDIWTQTLYDKGDENKFINCIDLVSQKALKNQEIFVDFFQGYDIHNACGYWSPLTDSSTLRIGFQKHNVHFAKQNVADINRIESHIRRSIELYRQQSQLNSLSLSNESPKANLALAIVDEKLRLVQGNDLFHELLVNSSLISEDRSMLFFTPKKTHNAIYAEIQQVIANFNSTAIKKYPPNFVLENGLLEKYTVSVSSYIHHWQGQRNYRALLTFKPIITQSAHHSRLLKQQFGLTESELEIVLCLCNGKSVEEIAKQRVRSELTVRTQLKQIFYKLGCDNQSQLVHTVLTLFSMYR